jgi:hypothetical protein
MKGMIIKITVIAGKMEAQHSKVRNMITVKATVITPRQEKVEVQNKEVENKLAVENLKQEILN